ncbi:MULE domain-containing protein [Aphis craccivora]|uniref:MULE domain-containing protein n=1 Tax=Aphis craccivora TaxID=307492 RepID=A0A6G0W488_APHCR|nr:MULE domain-containing protein [Aphis craccivora]
MQLYTIHVYKNYYYLPPLVYGFLKNKQVSMYESY